jgi:hypothetical protein
MHILKYLIQIFDLIDIYNKKGKCQF